MAEHPGIKLTVIRFLPGTEFNHTAINLTSLASHESETHPQVYLMNGEQEKGLDEEALQVINNKVSKSRKSFGRSGGGDNMGESIVYEEREMNSNAVESVLAVGQSSKYHMFLVGRSRFPSSLVADLADRSAEYPELGPIGDLLAASSTATILVIQQHDAIHTNEVAFSEKAAESTAEQHVHRISSHEQLPHDTEHT